MATTTTTTTGHHASHIKPPLPSSLPPPTQTSLVSIITATNNNMAHQQQLHHNSGSSSPGSRSRSISSDDHGFGSASLSQNSNGSPNIDYAYPRRRLYASIPNRTFICVKGHRPAQPGELELRRGDVVELLSVGDSGYWEGRLVMNSGGGPTNGLAEGWFKANCVEEFSLPKDGSVTSAATADSILVKRKTLIDLLTHSDLNAPRTIVLQKGKKGFGFVLRGAKSKSIFLVYSTVKFKVFHL
jgi:SH3/ankyrin repeat-containing protein